MLVEHLARGGYSKHVTQALGRALEGQPTGAYWEELKRIYLEAESPDQREAAALALIGSARKVHLDDAVAFVGRPELGETRLYFLGLIKRWGGEQGRALLASLVDDPQLGKEARARLGRRS